MLYHITNINGCKGIIDNHENNDLEFWISHYKDMNDDFELKQLYNYENDVNTIKFSKTICKDYFILSFTENPLLAYNLSHGDYGNIILGIDEAYLINKINFDKCSYSDDDVLLPDKYDNPFDTLLFAFKDRLLRFYVKKKEWEEEQEWRLVENAQDGEKIYPPREGKEEGYIRRSFPHNFLQCIYFRGDSSKAEIHEVLKILNINNFDISCAMLMQNGEKIPITR